MENVTSSGESKIDGVGSRLLQHLEANNNNSKDNNRNSTINTVSVTSGARNCTGRIRASCNRETSHFRFGPGNVSQSHSSQGVMALVVMLIVLCLLIMYCCWGGCCKLMRRRRRINRSLNSTGSCSSYPNVVVLPCRGGIYDLQDPSSRRNGVHSSRLAKNSHGRVSQLPPPPYDTLFGSETCNPPSYSSVCLPALAALDPSEVSHQADANQSTATYDQQNVSQAATGSDEPAVSRELLRSSNPSHCVVDVAIERSKATSDLLNSDHSRGNLPVETSRVSRSQSVPSLIGGSPQLLSALSNVHWEA